MGSFAKKSSGVATAMLAGTMLSAFTSAVSAGPAAGSVLVINVPCDSTQLPSAIAQANAAGAAIVRLASRCTYLTTSTLPIAGTSNITLLGGRGTAIKANPASGAFGSILSVATGATLRAQSMFILGGSAGTGGGINNTGSLLLDFMTVTGNAATGVGGGGIISTGRAVIAHSIIKANTADNGGGIFNGGALTLFESYISGNHGITGGGIYTNNGALTRVIQSTIDKNTATNQGGGINNTDNGITSLDHTMVAQNKADLAVATSGGGIFNSNPTAGSVTLRRSIVLLNTPNNCSSPPTAPIQGCLG
jgi:hypothetical protein